MTTGEDNAKRNKATEFDPTQFDAGESAQTNRQAQSEAGEQRLSEARQRKAILIVGQGPSKSGEGKPVLEGKNGSGARLAELAGITAERMHELADCINLLDGYEGKNGKGDKFNKKRAMMMADAVRGFWKQYKHVILLGRNVAECFGLDEQHPCTWHDVDSSDLRVAMIPHPSGVNREYNDAAVVNTVSTFLHGVFSGSVQIWTKADRAKHCTEFIEKFEQAMIEWQKLGAIIEEAERDELYLEVGCSSLREWIEKHAPSSRSWCYAALAGYKCFKQVGYTDGEMKQIRPETAIWAAKAKNISRAALTKPEVKAALTSGEPKKQVIETLKERVPDEHIEQTHNYLLKFSASQYNAVSDAFEAFKALFEEHASMEDFFEMLVEEFWDMECSEYQTYRTAWQKYKDTNGMDPTEEKSSAAVAAV